MKGSCSHWFLALAITVILGAGVPVPSRAQNATAVITGTVLTRLEALYKTQPSLRE